MHMYQIRIGLLISFSPCLLVFLCGCTSLSEYIHNGFKVGPNYATPPAPVAKDWIDAKEVIDAADKRKDKNPDDLTKWWKNFNDPVLDQLICFAYEQNLTLREAGFRILQARAQLGIAVGNFFPQSQFMTGSYDRIANSAEIAGIGLISRARFINQWNLGFSVAWEMDFWGRFRRSIESAGATLDASVEDYDDVLVTLLSDVATNYVQMRTLEKRIEYAKENVAIQSDTMENAKARLKAEKNGELILNQAVALLRQTEAGIPELEIGLRQTTNRLCVLLGIPPEELREKLGKGSIPMAEPPAVVGIPADLLRRRPDVRRAERQAAAQAALIGVAESEFYPHILLSGTLNYTAEQFKNVFRGSALNGSFGPSFHWDILNYGRILNNVRLQDAKFQELMVAYQNSVLTAQKEVEDGLIQFIKAQRRAMLQQECVDAADKAEKIAKQVRKAGGVDFTTLSLIQQNKVQQEDTLAQAQGEIALGLIQIYRALGGGWQIRLTGCEPNASPPLQLGPGLSEDSAPAPRPVARFGPPS